MKMDSQVGSMAQTGPFPSEHQTILRDVHKGRIKDLKLRDENLEIFFTALDLNTTFAGSLDISGHELTDQSVLKISEILEKDQPVITKLNLSGNTLIGAEGLKELGAILIKNKNLRILDLGKIKNEFVGCW